MEATCSSETSVSFQWNTQSYIPEDRTLLTALLFALMKVKGKFAPMLKQFSTTP
jgi:hypothetical protein